MKRGSCGFKTQSKLCYSTQLSVQGQAQSRPKQILKLSDIQQRFNISREVRLQSATDDVVGKSDLSEDQILQNGNPNDLAQQVVQEKGIAAFLRDKVIFISGATGFIAKVFVEKVLKEQPNVKQIYLLIQGKQNMSANDRLEQQVITSPVFKAIREQHGDQYESFMKSKLTAVQGSLGPPNLGIEDSIYNALQKQVNVVINSAATTTFDERYDIAVKVNALGAREAATFASRCTNLNVYIHVSTAFVNGERQGPTAEAAFAMGRTITDEKLGNAGSLDVQKEIEYALSAPEQLAATAKRNLGPNQSPSNIEEEVTVEMKSMGMNRAAAYGWQDTYVYTKSLGEMLVGQVAKEHQMPTVILRPSIVESAYREPLQGWMEGIRMADPILLAYGKGQVDGFVADRFGVLDIVPVDYVVNAMLASMPAHSEKPGVNVYQVGTSIVNPLSTFNFKEYASDYFQSKPMTDKKGNEIVVERLKIIPIKELFDLDMFVKYQLPMQFEEFKGKILPAVEEDRATRKRRLIAQKTYEQLSYLGKIYSPYTFYKCRFGAANTEKLYAGMDKDDQKKFNFNLRDINWREYIAKVHIPGLRQFVLKEKVQK